MTSKEQASEFRDFIGSKMLREKQVKDLTGLSRVTRWRLEARGEFPRKIKLSERCIGWYEAEILAWLQRRAEAR
jgi:prophage regulatory protein